MAHVSHWGSTPRAWRNRPRPAKRVLLESCGERLETERQVSHRDARSEPQRRTALERSPIDLDRCIGPTPELARLPVKNHLVAELWHAHVRLAGWAQHAGIGHEQDAGHGQMEPVRTAQIEPCGSAHRAGLQEAKLDVPPEADA